MSRHRLTDAEHTAEILAEIESARTSADQLALMRQYLVELDDASARFPDLDSDMTIQLRAELVEEIERLEKINTN